MPLTAFAFDLLHLDGDDLLDRPGSERAAALAGGRAQPAWSRGWQSRSPEAAEEFAADALARGHEGVMVKALDQPYEAGRRGAGWLKVKPVHTLDLVVLAAEWGHGRRHGVLSNLHLGARDPESGGFVMLGKTFKGLTDEMLAWQTAHLLELETSTRGPRRARPPRARRRDRLRRPPGAAPATPAASPCASPASSATGPTSAPGRRHARGGARDPRGRDRRYGAGCGAGSGLTEPLPVGAGGAASTSRSTSSRP